MPHEGTSLVVKHRRNLVERADMIVCLVDGLAAETGPPQALLCGPGPTARLFVARPPAPQR